MAVAGGAPRVLTLPQGTRKALPSGPLDAVSDRTLELAVRRLVRQQTEREMGYVEQLYTFGDLARQPGQVDRAISVAYLALVRHGGPAEWDPVYHFFPWEDWREGRADQLEEIEGHLRVWAGSERERSERIRIAFGLDRTPWSGELVLERYELLYEVGLIAESPRNRDGGFGHPLAGDHRRILATALGRIRGKIRYRPVVFELLPETFTLLTLQRTVEALAGIRLHKQNFRRLVEHQGLVEGTGQVHKQTGGRPAELFRFRRDVLTERPAPGVGLPGRAPT